MCKSHQPDMVTVTYQNQDLLIQIYFLYSIYKDEILNNSLLITDWDSSATKVGGKVPVLQACETRKSPGVGVVVVGPSVVVKAGVVDVAPGCTPLIFFNAQRNFSLTSLLVNASI